MPTNPKTTPSIDLGRDHVRITRAVRRATAAAARAAAQVGRGKKKSTKRRPR